MDEVRKGWLLLNVEEASGKNKEDTYVWDPSTQEGFVKVEVRGEGVRNVKVETDKRPVLGTSIVWKQQIKLEVLQGANELRLMVCRPKLDKDGNKKGTAVIAACGIYVKDILDNVPIDKYFELFKPNAGGDGGFIRIGIDFRPELQQEAAAAATPAEAPTATETRSYLPQMSFMKGSSVDDAADQVAAPAPHKKKGGPVKVVLLLALLGGAAGFVLSRRK